jgi:hypothetical protein
MAGAPRRSGAESGNQHADIGSSNQSNRIPTVSLFVMAGLDPAIPVFLAAVPLRRGCPGMTATPFPHPEEHRNAMRLEGSEVASWFETRELRSRSSP